MAARIQRAVIGGEWNQHVFFALNSRVKRDRKAPLNQGVSNATASAFQDVRFLVLIKDHSSVCTITIVVPTLSSNPLGCNHEHSPPPPSPPVLTVSSIFDSDSALLPLTAFSIRVKKDAAKLGE
jgi:hypothetical protein